MRRTTYHLRSLTHHWRTNLAVILGVAAGTASLTGALLVGDSMRASLRKLALGRLGRVDFALTGARFFEQSLASRIAHQPGVADRFASIYPLILLRGGVTQAALRARADGVRVMGIDKGFWAFHDVQVPQFEGQFAGRNALINQALADEIHAKPGDAILVRMGKPSAVSTETFLGRKDDTVASLRLVVRGIVPDDHAGQFSLNASRSTTPNVFVPIETLQRAISQPNRANAVIVSSNPTARFSAHGRAKDDPRSVPSGTSADSSSAQEFTRGSSAPSTLPSGTTRRSAGHARADSDQDPGVFQLQSNLHRALALTDLGLRLRIDRKRNYVALESDSILIDPTIEQQVSALSAVEGRRFTRVLAHLANRITNQTGKPGIPYSTIVAFPFPPSEKSGSTGYPDRSQDAPDHAAGDGLPPLAPDEILLNRWAADDLAAEPGDDIRVTYYVTDERGELAEQTTVLTLAGIVPMDHKILGDPGLVPSYPGITDVERLSDWDAPFPIDFTRIREKDEQYWTQYRTLPKAFVRLETGQKLWAERGGRFGDITSIQFTTSKGAGGEPSLDQTADDFGAQLLRETVPSRVGLRFKPVRARALAAATGSTDFGGLFLGFSFFLVISAAMLVALLFRLGVERRASEVGLLLAVGFERRDVRNLMVTQGLLLAIAGGLIGTMGASGYAWFMLAGLRTWWSAAVGITALGLDINPVSLGVGLGAGIAIAGLSIVWSLRGLTRNTERALLAGVTASDDAGGSLRIRKRSTQIAGITAVLAVVLVVVSFRTDAQARAGAFFGAGAATLTATLALLRRWLHGTPSLMIRADEAGALTRLGLRNAPRHAGRSLLTAGLIGSATFLIVSIQAFRLETDPAALPDKHSGSGGFNLYAKSSVPLPYDLSSATGRDSLGFDEQTTHALDDASILPLRLRAGDESSCLNLYKPTTPAILAASDALVDRGGFAFSATLAETDRERENPWRLLNKPLPDDAIPVIGDEAAVLWQLHLGLGKDLTVTDERGRPRTLRFVALLKQSLLQDELLIAEPRFVALFPSISGRAFFLIETPPERAEAVEQALERGVERFGLDVRRSADRLNQYMAVQNTYLATFRNLGGLGLLLGTTGLAAVLLRNVWERRRELALLRALGFGHVAIGWMVLVETVGMLSYGLGAGAAASLVAIAPRIAVAPAGVPWSSLAVTLAGVLVIGIGAPVLALVPTLRAPLLAALRTE